MVVLYWGRIQTEDHDTWLAVQKTILVKVSYKATWGRLLVMTMMSKWDSE